MKGKIWRFSHCNYIIFYHFCSIFIPSHARVIWLPFHLFLLLFAGVARWERSKPDQEHLAKTFSPPCGYLVLTFHTSWQLRGTKQRLPTYLLTCVPAYLLTCLLTLWILHTLDSVKSNLILCYVSFPVFTFPSTYLPASLSTWLVSLAYLIRTFISSYICVVLSYFLSFLNYLSVYFPSFSYLPDSEDSLNSNICISIFFYCTYLSTYH